VQTESFPDNTLDPITAHCIPNLTVHTYPKATPGLVTGQTNKSKPVASQSSAATIDLVKLPGFPEKTGLGEPVLLHQNLGRQPFTPLGTPAFNNCLTGTGPHTGAKAMCTFTLDITGLKSSLTHDIVPLT
jgi:hypothetical protein